MTNEEWRADLEQAVSGTNWVVGAATITQGVAYAFAALKNQLTHETRIINLPLDTLHGAAALRTAAVRRELA
jgi:hypothetical protein